MARWMSALVVLLAHLRAVLFVGWQAVPIADRSLIISAFYALTSFSHEAVIVFFVLSGFLVGGVNYERARRGRFDGTSYAIDRFTRIYVTFLPALLLTALADAVGSHFFDWTGYYDGTNHLVAERFQPAFDQKHGLSTFFGNAAMLQPVYVPVFGSNIPLWSLSYELWFYLWFGVAAGVTIGQSNALRSAIAVCIAVLLGIFFQWLSIFYLLFWCLGITALSWRGWPRSRLAAIALLLTSLAAATSGRMTTTVGGLAVKLSDVPLAFGVAWLLGLLTTSESRLLARASRFHHWASDFSYSLYVVHFPLMLLWIGTLATLLRLNPNFRNGLVPNSVAAIALYVGTAAATIATAFGFSLVTERQTPKVRRRMKKRMSKHLDAPMRRRMLVLCPYPYGVAAGQRLKFEQYYDDWRRAGWTVDVAPFMDLALWGVLYRRGHFLRKALGTARGYLRRLRDLLRIRGYDVVYCHMYVTPLGGSLFERIARRFARRLIFDVEDNVLMKRDRAEQPNSLLSLVRGTDKSRYLIRSADHVITSSPFLNATCLEINEAKACTYVSSSVDTDRFIPGNDYSNDDKVVIGWTGSFSTRPYLDLIRPVFQALAKTRAYRLRVIGNFDYDLPGVELEVVRWTAEREVEDLQAIDIGVYPLAEEEFATGKSGLKAIQYMAFGIPCVATGLGTAPLIIRDGENGLLVRTHQQWLDALRALIDDPELRRRLGEEARRDAVAKYSTKAIAAHYRAVLDSVMES